MRHTNITLFILLILAAAGITLFSVNAEKAVNQETRISLTPEASNIDTAADRCFSLFDTYQPELDKYRNGELDINGAEWKELAEKVRRESGISCGFVMGTHIDSIDKIVDSELLLSAYYTITGTEAYLSAIENQSEETFVLAEKYLDQANEQKLILKLDQSKNTLPPTK